VRNVDLQRNLDFRRVQIEKKVLMTPDRYLSDGGEGQRGRTAILV